MRIWLSLLVAFCAFARSRSDATALIQSVADVANNAKSWRIEGSITDSDFVQPATFTLLMRAPSEVRFQQIGGLTPAIIVCDPANAWVYSPPLNRYLTQSISQSDLCSPIVGEWKSISSKLKSPVLAGRRSVEIGGRTTDCQVIRGKSDATPPFSGDIKHELCVDTTTNLIVSEKDQYKHTTRTYTYSKIERDVEISPDVFVLKLPPRSMPTSYDLPVPRRLGSLDMSRDPGTSLPRLVSKQDPVYDDASQRAGIEGAVVLYVVIDTNGTVSDIDVFRHLTPGFDASAMQAVKQWHFSPAMKDNHPIAVGQMVQVAFKRI